MNWKITKADTEHEKNIITGLIVSNEFIRQIFPILNVEDLNSQYSKTIARWCLEFFRKYDKNPDTTIQTIYESKKDEMSESECAIIEQFLSNLSNRYETFCTFNYQYFLDQAEKYLAKNSLTSLCKSIQVQVDSGDLISAENLLKTYKKVSRVSTEGVDIFTDYKRFKYIFNEERTPLFKLPGVLGEEIGEFCREDMVAVFGPASRGKSWWLQEIGLRAALNGLKVLHVSLEMSRGLIAERIGQFLTGKIRKFGTTTEVPIPILRCNNDNCTGGKFTYECRNKECFVPYVSERVLTKTPITWLDIKKKLDSIKKISRGGVYKFASFASGSLSTDGLKDYLDNLKLYKDFVPDMVVVDYADIMDLTKKYSDNRDKIGNIWGGLDGIAGDRKCIVVTGSHTGRNTFNRKIKQSDPSEDIRKMAYISHGIALNQTDEEKKNWKMMVSVIKKRTNFYVTTTEVTVLEQKMIGRCFLDSYLEKN